MLQAVVPRSLSDFVIKTPPPQLSFTLWRISKCTKVDKIFSLSGAEWLESFVAGTAEVPQTVKTTDMAGLAFPACKQHGRIRAGNAGPFLADPGRSPLKKSNKLHVQSKTALAPDVYWYPGSRSGVRGFGENKFLKLV